MQFWRTVIGACCCLVRQDAIGHHGAALEDGEAGRLEEDPPIRFGDTGIQAFPKVVPDFPQDIPLFKPVARPQGGIPAPVLRRVFIDGVFENRLRRR